MKQAKTNHEKLQQQKTYEPIRKQSEANHDKFVHETVMCQLTK